MQSTLTKPQHSPLASPSVAAGPELVLLSAAPLAGVLRKEGAAGAEEQSIQSSKRQGREEGEKQREEEEEVEEEEEEGEQEQEEKQDDPEAKTEKKETQAHSALDKTGDADPKVTLITAGQGSQGVEPMSLEKKKAAREIEDEDSGSDDGNGDDKGKRDIDFWTWLPLYTEEEVAGHSIKEDCWLIAHGYVYDVTSMLDYHPGGYDAILKHAGKDSTADFDFHRSTGRAQWKALAIGKVKKPPFCSDDKSSCVLQ